MWHKKAYLLDFLLLEEHFAESSFLEDLEEHLLLEHLWEPLLIWEQEATNDKPAIAVARDLVNLFIK